MVETERETFPTRPLAPGDLVDRTWIDGKIFRHDPPLIFLGFSEDEPGYPCARLRAPNGNRSYVHRYIFGLGRRKEAMLSRVGVTGPAFWPFLRPADLVGEPTKENI